MAKKETADEFIKRLKKMPNPDLTDPSVVQDLAGRLGAADKEIREIDQMWARSAGRAFTKVVR